MISISTDRGLLLLAVAAGLLLIALDNSVLYTALPVLTQELGATAGQSLWIINAYPLVMAGLLLGAGTLGDRLGHRRMFLIGLSLFGIASLIAAFSPTPEILIGARAFLAVGAAAMMPATLALIRVTFTVEHERNLAIAIWGSLAVVGSAIGPIVGGFLLAHFWWGSVFLINVPVVVLAFVFTLFVAPKGEPDPTKTWDMISSLQALVALSALVVAIKEFADPGRPWHVSAGALVVAIAASVVFARRQARLPFPLLDFSTFRNAAFSSGVMAAVFAMFALAGIQLITTQRFQLVAGFTPMEAGLLVSVAALGSFPTALIGGAFLHRIGLRLLIAGGLAVAALSVVLAVWGVTHGLGLGWLIAGLLLTGAGVGAAMSVASTAIIGNAPVHRAGMAASVEEVSYEFGSLVAVALLGNLMSAIYTMSVVLPDGTPEAARDSMASAAILAAEAGPDRGPAIFTAGVAAFDRGYYTVMYIVAAMLALAALVTGGLLRGYGPGTASSSYPTAH